MARNPDFSHIPNPADQTMVDVNHPLRRSTHSDRRPPWVIGLVVIIGLVVAIATVTYVTHAVMGDSSSDHSDSMHGAPAPSICSDWTKTPPVANTTLWELIPENWDVNRTDLAAAVAEANNGSVDPADGLYRPLKC